MRSGSWRLSGKHDFHVGFGLKVLATALFRSKEAGPLGIIYIHTQIYTLIITEM